MTNLAARVASHLSEIIDMAQRLNERAIDRSNAREMPGGDALVALGPIAVPSQWAAVLDLHERQAMEAEEFIKDAQPDLAHEDPDELWPASEILAWWSEDYRQRLGMTYEGWRPTLASEAAFLRNTDVAEWIWGHEVHYEDYAADVARAKAKLENILHEGERSERTRVVCDNPVCENPRQLIRIYAAAAVDDRWKCTGCRRLYDEGDYLDAHATQLRSESADKFVSLPDAIGTLRAQGRAERTIRKWLEPPAWRDRCAECGKAYRHQERNYCKRKVKDPESRTWVECGGFIERAELVNPDGVVKAYCEINTHRVLVWWPDLWQRHRTTQQRKRRVAA